jgi:dUTP pyrophosphatase
MRSGNFKKNYKKEDRSKQPFSLRVKTVDGSIDWMPSKVNRTDTCFDVRARLDQPVILEEDDIARIKCGFMLDLLPGWEAQIRTNRNLCIKNGLCVIDSGIIDSSYKEEISIIVINNGDDLIQINNMDIVAHMVVSKVPHIRLWHIKNINPRNRNTNVEMGEMKSTMELGTTTERGTGTLGYGFDA